MGSVDCLMPVTWPTLKVCSLAIRHIMAKQPDEHVTLDHVLLLQQLQLTGLPHYIAELEGTHRVRTHAVLLLSVKYALT